MKKIIAIIALLFVVTSCWTNTSNTETINNTTSDTPVEETVEVTQTEEVVDLTPDEEKIVEDLLK